MWTVADWHLGLAVGQGQCRLTCHLGSLVRN